ncbi:MAG: LacI family DNA-binding transcriptional regulator [Victivallaceae bacterium]|nr:LacI family DNA-binding transcriptional regulator [Victivallaceae bacterium]
MAKKYTTTQIAALAHVSQSTVSRVLNGARGVSKEKCEAVQKILEEKDLLRKSRSAVSLRHERTIGILLWEEEVSPGITLRKLREIVAVLPGKFHLEILPPQIAPAVLEARVRRGKLDGVVLVGFEAPDETLEQTLRDLPHVWLNSHREEGTRGGLSLSGNEIAGRMAARYLLEQNAKRLAVLATAARNPGFAARISGFGYELYLENRTFDTAEIPGVWFEERTDEELFPALAALRWDAWDGIFIPDDRLTALVWHEWARRRIAPAHRPKVISCVNESAYLSGLWPRPATIDLCPELTARVALEKLIRKILPDKPDRNPSGRIDATIHPFLVPGESEPETRIPTTP